MTSRPRFFRHRYLNSVPSLSEEISELHHELPLTKIVKTLVNLYYYKTAEDEMKEHSQISHLMHRILGGGGGGGSGGSNSEGADISVFAIVILTLGLILITEGVLHALDHFASERIFFRKTLNTCYRELAILGIVEWMVHLYSVYGGKDYYEMADLVAMFTDVHYLLFYTAIFNAIQSFILFLGCRRQTQNWWVKTEELQISHYIELRNEFERLKQMLDMQRDPEETVTLRSAWIFIRKYLSHPVFFRKYHHLLIQVRFHELRINFIRANKLPLNIRVSEYLKNCEQEVLMQFIKIGRFTWIALMTATSLVYFALCIAFYMSNGENLGANAAKSLFYGVCSFFIVLTCVILHKVKRIFFQIMHTNLIECCSIEDEPSIRSDLEEGNTSKQVIKSARPVVPSEVVDVSCTSISSQLELFWGQDPTIIISTIQVIQFGYAMLLSYVFVYWSLIKEENWGPYKMISVCLICFGIFFGIMTRIVPRFILCTSIGQLVNKNKLRELLAKYRLEEAIQKKRKINAVERAVALQNFASTQNLRGFIDEGPQQFSSLSGSVEAPEEALPENLQQDKVMTDNSKDLKLHVSAGSTIAASPKTAPDGPHSEHATQRDGGTEKGSYVIVRPRRKCASEGVTNMLLLDTDDKSRMKSSSDDVSSICLLEDCDTAPTGNLDKLTKENININMAGSKRVRSKDRRSVSEGVAAMRMDAMRFASSIEAESVCEEAHFGKLAELVTIPTKDLPKISPLSDLSDVAKDVTCEVNCVLERATETATRVNRKLSRKKQMKKSFSEGVAYMRASTILENPVPEGSEVVPYERGINQLTFHAPVGSTVTASPKTALPVDSIVIDESQAENAIPYATELYGGTTKGRPRRKCASEGVDGMVLLGADNKSRTKSSSDGLTSMCLLEDGETAPTGNLDKLTKENININMAGSKRVRSKDRRSVSEGVAAMRMDAMRFASSIEAESVCEEAHFGTLAELVTMPTKDLPKTRPSSDLSDIVEDITLESGYTGAAEISASSSRKLSRKKQMKKSLSEGVAFMRAATLLDNPVSVGSGIVPFEIGANQQTLYTTKAITPPRSSENLVNLYSLETVGTKTSESGEVHDEEPPVKDKLSLSASNTCLDDADSTDALAKEACNENVIEQNPSISISMDFLDEAFSRVAGQQQSDVSDAYGAIESSAHVDEASIDNMLHLKKIRSFFLSKVFNTFNVFGTMSCLFVVAMRMNAFVVESHKIEGKLAFTPSAETLFWAEESILILIILEGLFRFYLFLSHRNMAGDLPTCMAGAFSCLLGILCMTILLLSEGLRPSKYGSFGSRAGAGMGKIEPFTCFIFFDFFSITFGNQMSIIWSKSKCNLRRLQKTTLNTAFMRKGNQSLGKLKNSFSSMHNGISCSDAFDKMGKETGTIIELWQMAIGLFPDIVEQYGELSGEMLQVMLGVPIEGKGSSTAKPNEETSRFLGETGPFSVPAGTATKISGNKSLNEKLPCGMDKHAHDCAIGEDQPVACEDELHHADIALRNSIKSDKMPASQTFNSDPDLIINSQQPGNTASMFTLIEPDAPLPLKMRRCERRLFPLLSRWDLVDVVLTEYELIYFDATDAKTLNDDTSRPTSALQHERDAATKALIATEGGREMLLREVTLGRKIVGHFDLRCINFVKVQRRLSQAHAEAVIAVDDRKHLITHEYWKQKSDLEAYEEVAADPNLIRAINKKRWERVGGDQLQINTTQGILQLRFLCDLEEQEAKLMNAPTQLSQKSEALVWGQALAEFRAKHVQSFNALRKNTKCDVEIVSREGKSSSIKALKFSRGHRRGVSTGHLSNVTAGDPNKRFRTNTSDFP